MLAALLATGLAALGLVAFLLHFRAWYQRETRGTGYFGRTSAERRAFKAQVARRSALVAKLARLRARLSPPRALPGIRYRGLAGPPQCRPADFAPRVGERKQRILKTHLPASLCPYDEQARYVYVTRHPVACFASCVDFVRSLLGPLVPPLPELVAWFCSERMWWGPWPDHADGWWRWAAVRPNVLFLHYEELLADLPAAVDRVAAFLDTPLSEAERSAVAEKSGFASMKAHEERFEMAPPTPFSDPQVGFLKSGRSDRHTDVGPGERARVLAFCRERLRGSPYPAGRYYPDLGA